MLFYMCNNERQMYSKKWLPTFFLDIISKCGDEHAKDVVEFVKFSNKSSEILSLLDFALALICHRPIHIRESVYDRGLDGIREINQHFIDKNAKTQVEKNMAGGSNFFYWLYLRLSSKQEFIKNGLLYWIIQPTFQLSKFFWQLKAR